MCYWIFSKEKKDKGLWLTPKRVARLWVEGLLPMVRNSHRQRVSGVGCPFTIPSPLNKLKVREREREKHRLQAIITWRQNGDANQSRSPQGRRECSPFSCTSSVPTLGAIQQHCPTHYGPERRHRVGMARQLGSMASTDSPEAVSVR